MMELDVDSSKTDLGRIEQKVYLSYHQDGLLDIFIGLFILGFGMSMANLPVFIPSLLWTMCILYFWPARKFVSYPRMGYARFSPERKAREKKKLISLAILLYIPVIGTIIIMKGFPSFGWAIWLKEHEILFSEVMAAVLVSAGAILSGVKRLYVYAGLTMMVYANHYLLKTPPHLFFVSLGIVILVSGIVMLIRFLRKYPKMEEVSYGKGN
jgi:hypothetical protein